MPLPSWAYVLGRRSNHVVSGIAGVLLAVMLARGHGLAPGWAIVLAGVSAGVFSEVLSILCMVVLLVFNSIGWLCANAVLGVLAVAGRLLRGRG